MGHTMSMNGPETGDRTPQYVHCKACQHEWIAVWLPMDAKKAARVLKAAKLCQMCGEPNVAMGKYPHPTPQGDPVAWMAGGDTGISSETIWFVMMGRKPTKQYFYPSPPSDPSDFGRCYRLLALMPSWRPRLPEVAAKYPEWKGLVEHWDELTTLWNEESPTGKCPKLYDRMKELLGEKY